MTQENNQQMPDDYIPFGDEWKAYMMKLPKAKIIDLYAQKGIQSSCQYAEIERLRGALAELVRLKEHKDSRGKDEHYESHQPAAWQSAANALALSPSVEQEGKEIIIDEIEKKFHVEINQPSGSAVWNYIKAKYSLHPKII